jgi:hypothetical protein
MNILAKFFIEKTKCFSTFFFQIQNSFCSDCHSSFFRKVVVYISFYTFFPVVRNRLLNIENVNPVKMSKLIDVAISSFECSLMLFQICFQDKYVLNSVLYLNIFCYYLYKKNLSSSVPKLMLSQNSCVYEWCTIFCYQTHDKEALQWRMLFYGLFFSL